MTVYVDEVTEYSTLVNGYRYWSHMWTDGDITELHRMAKRIGLHISWFQNKRHWPHYDIVPSKRRVALQKGAVYKSLRDWAIPENWHYNAANYRNRGADGKFTKSIDKEATCEQG